MGGNYNIEKKFSARYYSEKFQEKYEIKYDSTNRIWLYNTKNGLWEHKSDNDLDSTLRKEILDANHISIHYAREVINDIKGLTRTNSGFNTAEPTLIPFEDKIYDLEKSRFCDYSQDYFFRTKLPVKIDTNNKRCPKIDKFFKDLVGEDKKQILYELCAYCLYRGYPAQYFFFLYGTGQNGKSTFVNLLVRLLGKNNVSGVDLRSFQNNRFAKALLFEKLLNVSREVDESTIRETSVLKELTGGDLITAEEKFKTPFSFTNHAKILIQANSIPATADKTDAFYRRDYIIEFPNQFKRGENAIPDFIDTIPQRELEGFAYKLLKVLKKLCRNNFNFSCQPSIEEIEKQHERLSNPLDVFLKKHVKACGDCYITVREFKSKFLKFQRAKGYQLWTSQKLNSEMETEGYVRISKSLRQINGQYTSTRVWDGLMWKINNTDLNREIKNLECKI
jgi:putative DNA primase/helicase